MALSDADVQKQVSKYNCIWWNIKNKVDPYLRDRAVHYLGGVLLRPNYFVSRYNSMSRCLNP